MTRYIFFFGQHEKFVAESLICACVHVFTRLNITYCIPGREYTLCSSSISVRFVYNVCANVLQCDGNLMSYSARGWEWEKEIVWKGRRKSITLRGAGGGWKGGIRRFRWHACVLITAGSVMKAQRLYTTRPQIQEKTHTHTIYFLVMNISECFWLNYNCDETRTCPYGFPLGSPFNSTYKNMPVGGLLKIDCP